VMTHLPIEDRQHVQVDHGCCGGALVTLLEAEAPRLGGGKGAVAARRGAAAGAEILSAAAGPERRRGPWWQGEGRGVCDAWGRRVCW
jgi:hypothetical protein